MMRKYTRSIVETTPDYVLPSVPVVFCLFSLALENDPVEGLKTAARFRT